MRRRQKARQEQVIEAVVAQRRERLYYRPVGAITAGLACVGVLLCLLWLPAGRAERGASQGDQDGTRGRNEEGAYHQAFLAMWREYRPSSEVLLSSGTAARGAPAQVKVGGTFYTGDRLAFTCKGDGRVKLTPKPMVEGQEVDPIDIGDSALRCDGGLVHFEPSGPMLITLEPSDRRARLSWAVAYDRGKGGSTR